jgi:arylsulfatase
MQHVIKKLFLCSITFLALHGFAQTSSKPNILFIVSDDTGYGDLGPYGGGEGRGMPTPNIDKMAANGMTFFHFMPSQVALREGRPCKPEGFLIAAE